MCARNFTLLLCFLPLLYIAEVWGDLTPRIDPNSVYHDSLPLLVKDNGESFRPQMPSRSLLRWRSRKKAARSSPTWNMDPSTFTGAPIALCVVVKDDVEDLVEYLEYYRWLGVGKVYLYDDRSNPPMNQNEGVFNMTYDGFVEYTYMYVNYSNIHSFYDAPQGIGYNDCLRRSRGRHRWLMFFDADEFLVLPDPQNNNLTELLKAYEQYGGVGVNWIEFSGKPHVKRPKGGVLASYMYCMGPEHWDSLHIKTMAQQHRVAAVDSPHWVLYNEPEKYWTVDEHGEKVWGDRYPNLAFTKNQSVTLFALQHYTVRSDEDFERKINRKRTGDGAPKPRDFLLGYRNRMWELSTEKCTAGIELSKVCCPSLRTHPGNVESATESSQSPFLDDMKK